MVTLRKNYLSSQIGQFLFGPICIVVLTFEEWLLQGALEKLVDAFVNDDFRQAMKELISDTESSDPNRLVKKNFGKLLTEQIKHLSGFLPKFAQCNIYFDSSKTHIYHLSKCCTLFEVLKRFKSKALPEIFISKSHIQLYPDSFFERKYCHKN